MRLFTHPARDLTTPRYRYCISEDGQIIGTRTNFTIPGEQVGKSRMAQCGSWKRRPAGERYRAWIDVARLVTTRSPLKRVGCDAVLAIRVCFHFSVPDSWSAAKKAEHHATPFLHTTPAIHGPSSGRSAPARPDRMPGPRHPCRIFPASCRACRLPAAQKTGRPPAGQNPDARPAQGGYPTG